MYRITPVLVDTALDATTMANSLASTEFWYRALTQTSEDLSFYVQPNSYIPAFNLPADKTATFSRRAFENFSATLRALLKWDSAWEPGGWILYTTAERVEFFGTMFRIKLTEITFYLLSESLGSIVCHSSGSWASLITHWSRVRFMGSSVLRWKIPVHT